MINGIKEEYSKVSWPKKEEVKNGTLLVAAFGVASSLYLGFFDLIMSTVMKMLTSIFGG